ncbi:MAG: alanyl-tRNA editing protein [Bryobacteraceae bacterium]
MTHRLYYTDAYLRAFPARVVESAAGLVYLDRTAFYPASGGQPHDTGRIAGAAVLEVIDEGDRIAHRVSGTVTPGDVECSIDWDRRFDHMQQHTGQHLLSAVFVEMLGAATISFHLGEESSTIDIEAASLEPAAARRVEERANALVFENRPVNVSFEDASEAQGLRKAPSREGALRIITIEGCDRSACGGTHVRATGEIGVILIRKLEKIRGTTRVEFLCGTRAARRAAADYEALSRMAQAFSASLDGAPAMLAAHMEAARAAEKRLGKLELELAGHHGRELYAATPPDAAGLRRYVRRAPSGGVDPLRALAQGFTAGPRAIFLGVVENPPSLLLAASEDAGVDAGKIVKAAITGVGGRGGGTARIAQGSAGSLEALEAALAAIAAAL